MVSFHELNPIEQADPRHRSPRKVMLWEACAQWSRDPATRTAADVELTRRTALDLVRRGLIWMYRIAEGNPDLSQREADEILTDPRAWSNDSNGTNDVALYLTPEGERVYLGAGDGSD